MNMQTEHKERIVEIRRAVQTDAKIIARLFQISSDGLATYIWSRDKPEGVALLDHGAMRYARTGTDFSFENCRIATIGKEVVGMIHAFPMQGGDRTVEEDPIISPYSELEIPGSLYVSGLAVSRSLRRQGIGSVLLTDAERQAAAFGKVSLICFEANEEAMTFYRRRGYLEVRRCRLVPHATLKYTEGDAVLLAKEIA